jgi:hypothetical protein
MPRRTAVAILSGECHFSAYKQLQSDVHIAALHSPSLPKRMIASPISVFLFHVLDVCNYLISSSSSSSMALQPLWALAAFSVP